ncbi:DUF7511 domain-containing protein [Natronoglomus mannanivorans]|uniref:DUF7511 domain-containing protein n=1 Tax=Natronoglomus mannanivorans TaxID=2979990 RepID=UPI003CCCF3DA
MPTSQEVFGRSELDAVVIDNPNSVTECVLYPSNATNEELETMWILAKEGDYTHLADSR